MAVDQDLVLGLVVEAGLAVDQVILAVGQGLVLDLVVEAVLAVGVTMETAVEQEDGTLEEGARLRIQPPISIKFQDQRLY